MANQDINKQGLVGKHNSTLKRKLQAWIQYSGGTNLNILADLLSLRDFNKLASLFSLLIQEIQASPETRQNPGMLTSASLASQPATLVGPQPQHQTDIQCRPTQLCD